MKVSIMVRVLEKDVAFGCLISSTILSVGAGILKIEIFPFFVLEQFATLVFSL
jgi:hypothetical protein